MSVCKLERHHLWPYSQLSGDTHACAHTHIGTGVLMGACVRWIRRPHPAHRGALMNILIMLKSAPCPGFPAPSGKVNSGWLHSTARACGRTGAERLWRSALTVLDVSGPKIDLGMQSKYHGSIKAPSLMPRDKQTWQVKPPRLPRCSFKGPESDVSPHRSHVVWLRKKTPKKLNKKTTAWRSSF